MMRTDGILPAPTFTGRIARRSNYPPQHTLNIYGFTSYTAELSHIPRRHDHPKREARLLHDAEDVCRSADHGHQSARVTTGGWSSHHLSSHAGLPQRHLRLHETNSGYRPQGDRANGPAECAAAQGWLGRTLGNETAASVAAYEPAELLPMSP